VSNAAAEPKLRLHSLTSLRFFAAAFVVLHHTVGPDDVPIFDLGFLGVTFFFVLSGFVLTWAGSADRGALVSYRNRFARIYPLHLLTLLIAIALPLSLVDTPTTFVQNLVLLQAWTPDGAHSFNWVSWSISVEVFFYALFPIAVVVLRRFSTRSLATLLPTIWIVQLLGSFAIDAVLPGRHHFLTYDFPPYRFAEFLIGITLALLFQRGYRPTRQLGTIAAATAAAGLAFAVVADLAHFVAFSYFSSAAIPAVVVGIWVAVSREHAGHTGLLSRKWLRKLGDWSFALYLVHTIPLRIIGDLAGNDQTGYLPWWSALPILALCVGLSAIVHERIEQPLEKLLRSSRKPVRLSTE